MSLENKHAADLMPQNEEVKQVLQVRAESLAKEKSGRAQSAESVSYVSFTIDQDEFYGIEYKFVKEVLRNIKPTWLPCTPDYITGVINWRGTLIAVLDVKQFFHCDKREFKEPYGIVVKALDQTLAILVDAIEGSRVYDSLESPLTSANAVNTDYIKGLDQGVTAIINVEAVVASLKLQLG